MRDGRAATALAESFDIRKEECSGGYRSAQIAAKLVLVVLRSARCPASDVGIARVAGKGPRVDVEEVAGLEIVVTQKLPERATELFGTRFRNDVDLCAGALAELRRVIVRLNLEFLQGIDARVER